jgi:hypothetical protein
MYAQKIKTSQPLISWKSMSARWRYGIFVKCRGAFPLARPLALRPPRGIQLSDPATPSRCIVFFSSASTGGTSAS